MAAGRPNKTDQQKKLQGTFRKDRATNPMEFTQIMKVPDPPELFDEVAKAVWQTVCQEMIKLNILQNLDIFLLQILCNEMSVYWKCHNTMNGVFIVDTGTGSTKVNPMYTTASQALNNAHRIAGQFGLSPSARQKLHMIHMDKPKVNKAMDLINKRKAIK